ncbi:TEPSIN adaptor related protein complex 4 accessory protein [Phyllostomus discolor]|uniref:TEPSIN adaptor related protein complex 4 accessory protein n=1 Tax=Phyllostomus discolor TaxID=89673 RepID=A0A834DYU7_9CHIR|nr:TEPSIN adaptor related protein complex 4 accessory protein [Phyllostomus discolor]
MAATPLLRDRLNFLHRLPVLLKGTSDDDAPCPGYLFEEIAKISHESPGSSQCLLEYLLSRLHGGSGRVKLKVLKILLHLCGHGSPSFLLTLKRNPAYIQEASVFTGPPDPLHGNSLYQKDLGSALFSDSPAPAPAPQAPRALPPAGMGAQSRPLSALQGFGYSQDQGRAGSAGEAFLSTIQKAAEVVASAVRPGPEGPGTQGPPPRGDAYQPAVPPSASHGQLTPGNALPGARAVRHRPGQAGGGWDEQGGGPGSQSSSQESGRSKASDSGSRSGSDSPSGASRAPSDLAERVEAAALSDCQQELRLVQTVTQGPRDFLSQEEAQHFVKECGLLNCEAVLELLTRRLAGTSEHVQMRALSAIASLGRTDLLPQEHILLLARPRLQELSSGCPGPVTNKAVKILRHLEASCRQHRPAQRPLLEPGPAAACVGPSDLLADTVPFSGGQAFLQPLTSALLSPKGPTAPPLLAECPLPALGDTLEVETRLAGSEPQGAGSERGPAGADTPHGAPELGPGPGGGLWSPVARDSPGSLFAGMELVARPCLAEAGPAEEEPACAPWTLAPRAAAQEQPGSEPSAFAFLNS